MMIKNYKELPIGKYLLIMDLCEDREIEEIDRQVAIVALLTDKSEDELLRLPIGEYKRLAGNTAFMQEECIPLKRMPNVIKIGEWDLKPVTDVTKLTTSQYIDFQTFSKEGRSKYCEMLSCFLIPAGMDYNEGYDIVKLQDDIRELLSVEIATTLSAFFLTSLFRSISNSLTFSKWIIRGMKKGSKEREQMQKQIKEMETTLQANGGGLIMSAMLPKPLIRLGRWFGR